MTCCLRRGNCGHQDATDMWDPTSTDLVIRVVKDYTSIGQDDAYVGVKSHTISNEQNLFSKGSGHQNRSMDVGESWWSPEFATVCGRRGDSVTGASSSLGSLLLKPSQSETSCICILKPSPLPPCISKGLFLTSPFSIRAISRLSWSGLHTQTNSPKEEHRENLILRLVPWF